jgi:hypothetical protein
LGHLPRDLNTDRSLVFTTVTTSMAGRRLGSGLSLATARQDGYRKTGIRNELMKEETVFTS